MSRYKTNSTFYLDKDAFSAVTADLLWTKLSEFIRKNVPSFSSVTYDKKAMKINFVSSDRSIISNLLKLNSHLNSFGFALVRKFNLNTSFDKARKDVVLSMENVEDFENWNEVSYSIACNDKVDLTNSLFFHESSLIDYTIDNAIDTKNVLAIVEYDKKIEFTTSGIQSKDLKGCLLFLCYNTETQKLEKEKYPILNESEQDLDIDMFIDAFNSEHSSVDENMFTCYKSEEGTVIIFSNFKIAFTMFKMNSENDFINFRMFTPSYIYNSFIENAKKKLEKIWS